MGPTEPVTLLLVDDNTEVRGALARWFGYSKDFALVASFSGPEGVDDALVKLTPKVALIDWDIPGVDTYELLQRLVRNYRDTVFAVLSAHVEPPLIRAALRAGAAGYLSKGGSPARLAAEVRQLAEGLQVFSEEVKAALMNDEASGT